MNETVNFLPSWNIQMYPAMYAAFQNDIYICIRVWLFPCGISIPPLYWHEYYEYVPIFCKQGQLDRGSPLAIVVSTMCTTYFDAASWPASTLLHWVLNILVMQASQLFQCSAHF